MTGRALAEAVERGGGGPIATGGRGKARPTIGMPRTGKGVNRNGGRSGISHCAENHLASRPFAHGSGGGPRLPLTTRRRTGLSVCSSTRRGQGQGLGGAPEPAPPSGQAAQREWGEAQSERVGERRDTFPISGGGTSGISICPLCSGIRRSDGALEGGSTQANNQLDNSALLSGRVDNKISGWPPPLPFGAAPGSRNSGGVGLWPSPPPPPLEQHLVTNTMSAATPWKWSPLGRKHCRKLACAIGYEGGWGGGCTHVVYDRESYGYA